MAGRDFRELLSAQWRAGRFLCVGLDSDFEKIPETARKNTVADTIVNFNRAIIDATRDLVCAYKPNNAFYEAHGDEGWRALRATVQYINEQAPEVPVILDSKRADIGNTNLGYVDSFFEHLHVDAITVPPYLGKEALEPFLSHKEKGIFVLCRTSNGGAGEFQDLKVGDEPFYKVVAQHVSEEWNTNGNCGLVVGATYPEEMKAIREIAPDLPFLIPGLGAQNGDLKKSVQYGKSASGRGLVLAASRAIIFASSGTHFAEVARQKSEEFNSEIAAALIQ
ncbi:orotidine-5'-phosphate decarboxylase [Candidatus Parcubacteria bacterium]|nr:MAG: orotidine-5'-phosphate decarboxylase [Candidatus Parcubacteria bacterium]